MNNTDSEKLAALCERIFFAYTTRTSDDFSKGDLVEFALEHYLAELEQCRLQAFRQALAYQFTQIMRARRASPNPEAEATAQLSFAGIELPGYLTLAGEEPGEFRHKPIEIATIAEMQEHIRIREEHVVAVKKEIVRLKTAVLNAMEVAGGDASWTWGQVLSSARRRARRAKA